MECFPSHSNYTRLVQCRRELVGILKVYRKLVEIILSTYFSNGPVTRTMRIALEMNAFSYSEQHTATKNSDLMSSQGGIEHDLRKRHSRSEEGNLTARSGYPSLLEGTNGKRL